MADDNSIDPEGEFTLDVPEHFFYLLFQAVRRRDLTFDAALAPTGLTLARWRTLSIIRRIEACTMKELAFYSTIDRTTLTRSVDQLVAEGLVDRSTPPKDRRQVILGLTERGEAVYDEAVNLLLDFNRGALDGVSHKDQRVLARVLHTILRNMLEDREAEALIGFGRAPSPA